MDLIKKMSAIKINTSTVPLNQSEKFGNILTFDFPKYWYSSLKSVKISIIYPLLDDSQNLIECLELYSNDNIIHKCDNSIYVIECSKKQKKNKKYLGIEQRQTNCNLISVNTIHGEKNIIQVFSMPDCHPIVSDKVLPLAYTNLQFKIYLKNEEHKCYINCDLYELSPE